VASRRVEFEGKSFEIAYDIINAGCDKCILFLHGWGSNKEVMKLAFEDKFANFSLIFVDMPGFGKTTNEYVLTTADYAQVMQKFLESIGCAPFAIFGHSFGGKVATLLAPPLLCLLSSAGIVEPKPFRVRAKIKIFKLLKKIFGDSLYKLFATKDAEGMPKNMYETLKNVVDEDFRLRFETFKNRTLIFWGRDDRATHLSSGKQISSLVNNSKLFVLEGDHYFFIKNASAVEELFFSNL